MIWIGVRALKTKLSQYVKEARRGEEIVVTDHGRPVARLVGDLAPNKDIQAQVASLVNQGLVLSAQKLLKSHKGLPLPLKGQKASQIILEQRR